MITRLKWLWWLPPLSFKETANFNALLPANIVSLLCNGPLFVDRSTWKDSLDGRFNVIAVRPWEHA